LARIVAIGEGMLELARATQDWRLGHGGDVLNTATHLARAGHDVALLSALGTDPFSDQLRHDWQTEGIDTSLILTDPRRGPGLYAISTNDDGERSFTYWRSDSAARRMFECDGVEQSLARAEAADLLFFSLITLAILPAAARARLLATANAVRARGGQVAFDGNFRYYLWGSAEEARAARDAAIACATIGLPTLDDERALSGTTDADAVATHWRELGCAETVVKLGADGCRLPDGSIVPPPAVLTPVDTSGAGDAFDAGYLDARLRALEPHVAAEAGHRLAGWTVMRRGAIPKFD
jgi:2-dehydro-3-deoxygluconokinase